MCKRLNLTRVISSALGVVCSRYVSPHTQTHTHIHAHIYTHTHTDLTNQNVISNIFYSHSFKVHLHFLGTSANALNFQAYVVEGLSRWNMNRSRATLEKTQLQTYSGSLIQQMNHLSKKIFGGKMLPDFIHPGTFTGNITIFAHN